MRGGAAGGKPGRQRFVLCMRGAGDRCAVADASFGGVVWRLCGAGALWDGVFVGRGMRWVVGVGKGRPVPGVVLGTDHKRKAWQSRPQVFPPRHGGLGAASATTASCGEVLRS